MTSLPDTTLIEFAKSGNTEAIAVLYQRHQAFLLAASRTYAGGDLEPDDLVQEAWLRILNQLDRFTPRKSFRAWAITVLRNLGRDHATQRSRHKQLLEIHHHDVVGERVDGRRLLRERTTRETVLRALEPLTPRQRLALWLHVGERMPSAEVSRTMGCTSSTVRTTCFFALERIRNASRAGHTTIAN